MPRSPPREHWEISPISPTNAIPFNHCRTHRTDLSGCRNTRKDLNPFLQVSLDRLSPTLPPVLDVPVFDMQTIASGPSLVGGSNPQAFSLVVIGRPQDAVINLNKRDGSHIELLS